MKIRKCLFCGVLFIFQIYHIFADDEFEKINELMTWIFENPETSNCINLNERQNRLMYIDDLAVKPKPDIYREYVANTIDKKVSKNTELEKRYSIFYLIRKAEEKVLNEIIAYKNSDGVKIWKLYNMGLIIKTEKLCIGIDLYPYSIDFSKYLDLLIISHGHPDHNSDFIRERMLESEKYIYSTSMYTTNFDSSFETIIRREKDFKFHEINIHFDISSQGPKDQGMPCLITVIDLGAKYGNKKIIHSGDANQEFDFRSYENVELLECHSDAGLYLIGVVNRLQPKIVILSHILEQAFHDEGLKYKTAFKTARDIEQNTRVAILMWGESISIIPIKKVLED